MGKNTEKPMEEGDSKITGKTSQNDQQHTPPDSSSSHGSSEVFYYPAYHASRNTSQSEPHTSSHLVASTSSPSLLAGCANADTHIGANIERHVRAHNVCIYTSTPLSPIPMSPNPNETNPPTLIPPTPPAPVDSDIPPDSVFLTPSPPRLQSLHHERPSSAPANYLERISGTLLRLVGDHYLCCTCGRQLRTIGDQLTMETNINHVRRALSVNQLNASDNGS